MTKQRNATLTTDNIQPEARRSLLGEARRTFALGVLALLILLLPCSILAAPIVVTINDIPNGAPVIEVFGAPNGYNIYTGDCVNNPAIENGALITLFGVDTAGSIPHGNRCRYRDRRDGRGDARSTHRYCQSRDRTEPHLHH